MKQNKTAVERAFELARSGQFKKVSEVKIAVWREGYEAVNQIGGVSMQKQLREAIRIALLARGPTDV